MKFRDLSFAAQAVAAVIALGAPSAGATTVANSSTQGMSAVTTADQTETSNTAAAVVTRTGLVHFQAGGCLAASKLAWRAAVIVTACHPGRQSDTWTVRSTSTRVLVCIVSTFMCLNHLGGTVLLLSVYAVGAWIVYHQFGRWSALVEGQLNLTSNGYSRAVSWWSGFTANAGRQLISRP